MLAGIPREVTLAPNVAPVEVMEVDVGVVTVGTVSTASPKSAKTEKCVVLHVTVLA
ncbi:MAG: hypothetical protein WCK88_00875 [bacterium]